jgi:8-hydroxy-5-deazaflavin:NADPH oxidoreductase
MKISVIGAGNVGGTLGHAFAAHGHEVIFGLRDPQSEKYQGLLQQSGTKAMTPTEAVKASEIVVIAVPGSAVQETIFNLGDLSGKIIIDTTNRFGVSATSVAEDIVKWTHGAKVVKAFNTMGFETMANPKIGEDRLTAFVCGDDQDAKDAVIQLANDIGMDGFDAGGLVNAAYLEAMAKLWITLSRTHGRHFAFKLLR